MRDFNKRGDDGTTALLGAPRRAKDDVRIEAYGTLDELSSLLGRVVELLERESDERRRLLAVQGDLFALAAVLASPERPAPGIAFGDDRAAALEAWIDRLAAETPPLTSFVRPGGTPASAAVHLARADTPRAERRLVTLRRAEPDVDGAGARYLNRLADALFSLARWLNHRAGVGDEPPEPRGSSTTA